MNGQVTISVENVGEPIEASDIPRVFDSYYRASNVDSGKKGWGLGLAFVKRIAEKHGGSVSVQSHVDGNSFHIQIPAKSSVAAPAKETV
jgi:two-component system heavy metal sensor histidine kinase CusS